MDSSLSAAKTKNEFLNKAYEARQARELARRQDSAAATIQAYLKAYHVRQKLKSEACKDLDNVLKSDTFPDDRCLLNILRKFMFLCDPIKDEAVYNSLLKLVYSTSSKQPSISVNKAEGAPTEIDKTPKEDEVQQIELSRNSIEQDSSHSEPKKDFIALLAGSMNKDDKTRDTWINILGRILNICLDYLNTRNASHLDFSRMDLQCTEIYFNLINTFTSKELADPTRGADESVSVNLELVADQLLAKTKTKMMEIHDHISTLISKVATTNKTRLLENYTRFTLRLIGPSAILEPVINDTTGSINLSKELEDTVVILVRFLCIPALIHHLEQNSLSSIEEINEHSTFKLCLKLLAAYDQNLQNLTSTPALCLLANLIHLASSNEDTLISDKVAFVVLITKLLEACQKNMKHLLKPASGQFITGDKKNKKKNVDSTDESYNHILGWLAREQAATIDRDASKLIRSQLGHLWNSKFLKILLNDLIKANEGNLIAATKQANTTKSQTSTPKCRISQVPKRSIDHENPVPCDIGNSSPSAMFAIKRAMERAASSMTKTFTPSKTSSSNHSGSAKLTSEEASRISSLCYMLHGALKTFKIIKQDILTAICLHDYILHNLWLFIRSLGTQNGLKAFLDHLAIHTKSSAPEFNILTLFCECASHLISILDDSELYEQQKPFSLEDLINISSFLNVFVYRIITNHLVSYSTQDIDPILQTTHKLLTDLYKRDCRRKFAPQDHWLIKEIKLSIFLKDLEAGKPVAKAILNFLPHTIPHRERILIFRKLVAKDKAQYCSGFSTFITIHRSKIVEDGYQQLARLPSNALKGRIIVKFINDHGLDEAGIDQDGVFKEFLEETIKRVFDPALNLFSSTSEQHLYPSPTSRLHEDHLSLFNFVGKMVGKAVYEGMVVNVPFATFFLSRVLGQPQSPLYSPIDELPSLDPELYKSLTYIKHYEGDVSELDLTFSIDQDFMGKLETYELETGGKFIPVTKESRVRYIHSVANFRMKTQIEEQTEAFVRGFKSIVNIEWLSMFSASEFQRLISGDTSPIDLQDLRRNTKYFGGFHNNHRVVCWLWDILEKDFTAEEHRLFLKFVTSCSKPPLLGFANLEPPFSIRCVEVSDDQDLGDTVGSVLRGFLAIRRSDPVDRLPTSATCFNLLKLPNYQRRSTLREKLRYAIRSSPGFELS